MIYIIYNLFKQVYGKKIQVMTSRHHYLRMLSEKRDVWDFLRVGKNEMEERYG